MHVTSTVMYLHIIGALLTRMSPEHPLEDLVKSVKDCRRLSSCSWRELLMGISFITVAHNSVVDLGIAGAIVKFKANYTAKREYVVQLRGVLSQRTTNLIS